MGDRTRGLYRKFMPPIRMDGRSRPGEKHEKCQYFVLDMDHDDHAAAAAMAYAASCADEYPMLASDLISRWGDAGKAATPTPSRVDGTQKMFFGTRNRLFNHPSASLEHLSFETEGRAHTHRSHETCYVVSGRGQIVCGDQTHQVVPGSLVTIPPDTQHWMIPTGAVPLEIIILYHPHSLQVHGGNE